MYDILETKVMILSKLIDLTTAAVELIRNNNGFGFIFIVTILVRNAIISEQPFVRIFPCNSDNIDTDNDNFAL